MTAVNGQVADWSSNWSATSWSAAFPPWHNAQNGRRFDLGCPSKIGFRWQDPRTATAIELIKYPLASRGKARFALRPPWNRGAVSWYINAKYKYEMRDSVSKDLVFATCMITDTSQSKLTSPKNRF